MSNLDSGNNLMFMTHEYYDELLRAYDRKSWNVVVRHSQEVVELSLKSMLKIMGVEYPKSHDIATVFVRVCDEIGIKLEPELVIKIKDISEDLADKRSPAFYMERIYKQEDGEKAKADAEFVLNFAEALSVKLKGNR
jgi:HEPN domain-containing protein